MDCEEVQNTIKGSCESFAGERPCEDDEDECRDCRVGRVCMFKCYRREPVERATCDTSFYHRLKHAKHLVIYGGSELVQPIRLPQYVLATPFSALSSIVLCGIDVDMDCLLFFNAPTVKRVIFHGVQVFIERIFYGILQTPEKWTAVTGRRKEAVYHFTVDLDDVCIEDVEATSSFLLEFLRVMHRILSATQSQYCLTEKRASCCARCSFRGYIGMLLPLPVRFSINFSRKFSIFCYAMGRFCKSVFFRASPAFS